MADGGIVESALISAAIGGGTSAITGGDPLKGALMGGLMGGLGYGMFGPEPAAATEVGKTAAAQVPPSAFGPSAGGITGNSLPLTNDLTGSLANTPGSPLSSYLNGQALTNQTLADTASMNAANAASAAPSLPASPGNFPGKFDMNLQNLTGPQGGVGSWYKSLTPAQKIAGGAGIAGGLLGRGTPNVYKPDEYNGPLKKFHYDPNYFTPSLPASPRGYADGGITTLRTIGASSDPRRNPPPINVPNTSDWQGPSYNQPTQQQMAGGGITGLGSYSDGGRLLKGPGDGVSDNIPATIGGHQPARLADGEFVVPARIVSEIGNGSTDAGAKRLYAMMDRVQNARRKTTGKGKFAANTRSEQYLPA